MEAAAQACNAACQTKQMKDAAAALGANSLRIDYISGGSAASGTAFDCPGQPSLASAPEDEEASESESESEASERETETETDTSDTDDSDEPASDESEP